MLYNFQLSNFVSDESTLIGIQVIPLGFMFGLLRIVNLGLFAFADDFMQKVMVKSIEEMEWEKSKKKKEPIPMQPLLPAPSPVAETSYPPTSSQVIPLSQVQPLSSRPPRIRIK